MTADRRRLFLASEALAGDRLAMASDDARRAEWLGIKAGDEIVALDGTGWAWTVTVDRCESGECTGTVTARSLAPERRTQIALYHGVLHPYDYRRLLVGGTSAGVVAFVPLITDGSPVAALGSFDHEEEAGWLRLVRDAAETAGRGRLPVVSSPMLLDNAMDDLGRTGSALVLVGAGHALGAAGVGRRLGAAAAGDRAETTDDQLAAALRDRPFSIDLFCPPVGGFSNGELDRMVRHGVGPIASPDSAQDPVLAVLAVASRAYDLLEDATPDRQAGRRSFDQSPRGHI